MAFMASPYHFGRTPSGQCPGEGTINPNPYRLFESLRQWAWDQKAALELLRESCGLEPSAVIGFSMGAFQSLLVASAGGLNLPIVSIASTNRYVHGLIHGALGSGILGGMALVGIDEPRLRRMVESIELERYVHRLRGRPVLYIDGIYDPVDPHPSSLRLEQALQPVRTLHLEAGHGTLVLSRRRILEEIRSFLNEIGAL